MNTLKNYKWVALFAGALMINACTSAPNRVEIKEKEGAFLLYRGGEPYFIKGAVGWDYLDRLAAYGGNSLRCSPGFPDQADSLGLTVLANLPVKAQRDGFGLQFEGLGCGK